MPEKTLNELRSKQFIPGTKLELGEKESRIPVILIQRPGLTPCYMKGSSKTVACTQQQIGYASGWDIIIPAGWAMAFWIALVYRGARVGGQREATSISLQARQLLGVRDFPDSKAGKMELAGEALALQTKHDKRPPSKRPNYAKLGVKHPFIFPFDQLCNEWVKNSKISLLNTVISESNIHVLRDRRILKALNSVLIGCKEVLCLNKKNKVGDSIKVDRRNKCNLLESFLATPEGERLASLHCNALLPVVVKIVQRGLPFRHAHICIPCEEDLNQFRKTKDYGGPIENLHPDEDAQRRKAERKERLKLRKKRKRSKKSNKSLKPSIPKNEELTEKIVAKEPPVRPFKISDTTRPVIGYLTGGDFDLGQGQGSGLGFCSVAGLLHLMNTCQRIGKLGRSDLVLVRNISSLQYRFASISIVL